MIPNWIPTEAWAGYVEMRKKIKKPMTDRAIQLAINTLDKLRNEGHDIGAVLDQSVMNSWQGLFPISERRVEARQSKPSRFPSLGKHGQATANNLQDSSLPTKCTLRRPQRAATSRNCVGMHLSRGLSFFRSPFNAHRKALYQERLILCTVYKHMLFAECHVRM